MRVGLVCPYSFDIPGGVQNHVSDLAEILLERGHHVSVLAPGDDEAALPAYVVSTGRAVPVPFNGSIARVAFGPRVAHRVRRWLDEGEFDVVHVHEPTAPSVSLLTVWSADVPIVATFHTSSGRSRVISSSGVMLRPTLEKISARIAVSEAARQTLVSHIGGEPVVIPNGIFCDRFANAARRLEWSGTQAATVAFLGRVDESRKGLPVLLAAWPAIAGHHPGSRLLIAGTGEVAGLERLPREARMQVEVLGRLSDDDRASLLASATVYVGPQTGGESFGIVLVEAMAAGAVVAASDLGAFERVLGGGRFGALFRNEDPESCAAVVGGLLDDPVRAAGLRAAAAAEVRRYDWPALVGRVESIYETVVAAS